MSFLTLLFVREEEKSVKQFLSIIERSLRMHAKALIMMMAGIASTWILLGYLAQEHPAAAILSSLLVGFAPIIGLCAVLVILSLLISFLICTVERTLVIDDDSTVPAPNRESKWHRIAHCLPDQLASSLSLKEHSPPTIHFS